MSHASSLTNLYTTYRGVRVFGSFFVALLVEGQPLTFGQQSAVVFSGDNMGQDMDKE